MQRVMVDLLIRRAHLRARCQRLPSSQVTREARIDLAASVICATATLNNYLKTPFGLKLPHQTVSSSTIGGAN
jgi:hypothetical protein